MRQLWTPHQDSEKLLDRAWAHLESVPYLISLRWLFYRLLQDGIYGKKGDYLNMKQLFSKARKHFWKDWTPDSLADETRHPVLYHGYETGDHWLKALQQGLTCHLDKWYTQPQYIELWFEARAMQQQFEYYASGLTLRPFGGDPSIPFKFEAAQYLAKANKYGVPIKIFYYGDRDPKGEQIDLSALADIREWCDVPFEFQRMGLSAEQAQGMGVPENPEKPGEYQWEALTDDQAQSLIQPVLDLIDQTAWSEVENREQVQAERVREHLSTLTL